MAGKLASVRLLMVEDDASDADLVRRALKRAGGLFARLELDIVERVQDARQSIANGWDRATGWIPGLVVSPAG